MVVGSCGMWVEVLCALHFVHCHFRRKDTIHYSGSGGSDERGEEGDGPRRTTLDLDMNHHEFSHCVPTQAATPVLKRHPSDNCVHLALHPTRPVHLSQRCQNPRPGSMWGGAASEWGRGAADTLSAVLTDCTTPSSGAPCATDSAFPMRIGRCRHRGSSVLEGSGGCVLRIEVDSRKWPSTSLCCAS